MNLPVKIFYSKVILFVLPKWIFAENPGLEFKASSSKLTNICLPELETTHLLYLLNGFNGSVLPQIPSKNCSLNVSTSYKKNNISVCDISLKIEVGMQEYKYINILIPIHMKNFKRNNVSFWCSDYPVTPNTISKNQFRKIWCGQFHFFKVHPVLALIIYIDRQKMNFEKHNNVNFYFMINTNFVNKSLKSFLGKWAAVKCNEHLIAGNRNLSLIVSSCHIGN